MVLRRGYVIPIPVVSISHGKNGMPLSLGLLETYGAVLNQINPPAVTIFWF